MKRIYVAGAFNGPDVLTVLENMQRGMRVAVQILMEGFAPFTPWHDFHHTLMLREGEKLPLDTFYAFSIAWLKVSDAMFLVPGWEESHGTSKEIKVAKQYGIPIFKTIGELKIHFLSSQDG